MVDGPRPNILLIMADQLGAPWLPVYGHPIVRAPHVQRLAADGVTFDACYTNSPICVAARAALMTGRHISAIGAYDNGTEFPASTPTFVHHLRRAGYQTVLSGKMHFIGPDQLHGFEERLTTDIYPASFDWTPDWRLGPVHNPGTSVREVPSSGVCHWSVQLDYDEETHLRAVGHLYELARRRDRAALERSAAAERPWFMCVSYTHPHDPFTITPEYWERYRDDEVDVPPPAPPLESLPAYDRWLQIHHEVDLYADALTEDVRRAARRAYYGMVSYVDDKLGDLRHHLTRAGFADNTLILFTSDHGEMLGERGMWYKRTFYEPSAHIPLIAAWPGTVPGGRRETGVVSLVDLFPTFIDLAGSQAAGQPSGQVAAQSGSPASAQDRARPSGQRRSDPPYPMHLDGNSLAGLLAGHPEAQAAWPDRALAEYLGEGVIAPCRLLRQGRYKYVYVHGEAPQLFDVVADPAERHDLAGRPELATVEAGLRAALLEGWDPDALQRDVMESQQTRIFLREALHAGTPAAWDYQPLQPGGPYDDTRRFVRDKSTQHTAADHRVPRWQ